MTNKKVRRQRQLQTDEVDRNVNQTKYTTPAYRCANCGKEIAIPYPHLWAYKHKVNLVMNYWCSWHCLRESEKREEHEVKLAMEDKKVAIQIALEGGNPLEYIRACGVSNPETSWYNIKQMLKAKDPKTFERLPERLPHPKSVAATTAESAPAQPAKPGIKPLSCDGYTVRCIEGAFGKFYWDDTHKTLDWTTPDGEEVSLSPDAWNKFTKEELPKVMALLGVTA